MVSTFLYLHCLLSDVFPVRSGALSLCAFGRSGEFRRDLFLCAFAHAGANDDHVCSSAITATTGETHGRVWVRPLVSLQQGLKKRSIRVGQASLANLLGTVPEDIRGAFRRWGF